MSRMAFRCCRTWWALCSSQRPFLPQNLGEHLGRLLETMRGAMLRLRLRQQIKGDDEERVDGIVGARQRDWRGQ